MWSMSFLGSRDWYGGTFYFCGGFHNIFFDFPVIGSSNTYRQRLTEALKSHNPLLCLLTANLWPISPQHLLSWGRHCHYHLLLSHAVVNQHTWTLTNPHTHKAYKKTHIITLIFHVSSVIFASAAGDGAHLKASSTSLFLHLLAAL